VLDVKDVKIIGELSVKTVGNGAYLLTTKLQDMGTFYQNITDENDKNQFCKIAECLTVFMKGL